MILDFDGVINDSAKSGLERIIKIVADAGHEVPPDIKERLIRIWGTHGTKLIEVAFSLDSKASEEIYKEWERIDAVQFFPLILDVRKTLVALKQNMDLTIGMLTSRNRKNLMTVLNHHGLSELFDAIQCRDDYAFSKPHPRAFEHILSLIDVRTGDCVYVGDTEGDLQAASGADIGFIGVETGFLKRPDWQALGLESENIISDIGFLPCWILKHF